MNERRRRYLTAAEVAALSVAAGRGTGNRQDGSYEQYRLVIFTLSYCGLRWGEVAALKVDRVNLVRRRLDVAETITEVNGRIAWGTPTATRHDLCRYQLSSPRNSAVISPGAPRTTSSSQH